MEEKLCYESDNWKFHDIYVLVFLMGNFDSVGGLSPHLAEDVC